MPSGVLKLNRNVAVNNTSQLVGMGMVLRDCLGHVSMCMMRYTPGLFDSKNAEASCLLEALS